MARDIGVNFALGASLTSGFRGSMSAAQTQIAGLAQGIRRLESSGVGRLGADFAARKSKIKGLGTELRDATSRLAALRERAEAAGGASGMLARQIARAERRVQGLSGNLRRSTEAYREHIARVRNAEGSVRDLSRNYRELSADIDRARRSQAALSANLARRDALRDQRSDLRGRIVGTVGMGMAAAAPAGLAIGFEDAMARVGAVSKATDAQMVALTAKAREMGRDTRYSASQAAEGMGYLAMAGFNAQQQIDAIGGVLNVAAAAGADLGRTSDIVSNALTGFGLTADQAGRVGDVLTETFTSSNTTLETLGETLKYVAPVAKAAGANIEFAAAVAGVMGDAGIQGSMAGTAMRSMFTRLVAPARDAQKHMSKMGITAEEMAQIMADPKTQEAARHIKKMGIQVADENGNLRDWLEILTELSLKMDNLSEQDRLAAATAIFGKPALAGGLAVLDSLRQDATYTEQIVANMREQGATEKQIAEYRSRAKNKLTDRYNNNLTASREGRAQQVAQRMEATTGGALRRMRSAFEDLGIAVGNVFLPTIAKGADALGGLALKASALVERFPKLSGAVAHVGAGIVGLAVGSLVLGYAFNTVRTGLNMARGAMLLFSAAQTATAGTTRTLTLWQHASRLATMGWRDALTGGRAAVVGLAGRVAAFAGIQRGATLGTVAFTVAQKVMAAGSAIAGGALRVLGMAVRFALGPLGLILTALTLGVGLIIDNWDTVGPYFQGLWDGVVGIFRGAWDIIRGIVDQITGAVSWIGEQMDKVAVLSSAKSGLGKAWDWAFGDDEDEAQPAPTAVPAALPPTATAAPASLAQTVQAAVPTAAIPAAVPVGPPAPAPQKPAVKGADMPALTAGEAVTPVTMNTEARVPQRAEREAKQSRTRKAVNDLLPGSGDLSAPGGTSITVPMTFTVQGLDVATFKQKMKECRSDIEAIVKRVVADCQHQKTRTAYVPQ